ncbi:bone morphogenetic protein 1-like [Saccostrea echinata]|uniref:bone morphogenetic protein 1-like n=1 Tax=Saccostrea echinata TaxID=191078 RepID=UPI002A81F8A7|nr:bone morphogenetic protein 1-like [Saccostrea echinata]
MCGKVVKMFKSSLFFVFVTLLFNLTIFVHTLEIDLTVDVKPGYEECFFEEIKKPTSFEIEYQVIDGGDLDINFMVTSPHGRIMVSELQKSDAVHKLDATEVGVYKVCFDNSFSHFARKLVFFEIMTGDDDEDEEDDDKKDWKAAQEELSSIVDMTLEDFKRLLDNVNNNLDKARSDQQILRNYEARDRNQQENNFQRVNFFSGVQVFIMLSVALTQVLLIRSLFDDKKREVITSQRTRRPLVPIHTWPDGIVPYEIPENSFDKQSRALIRVAMNRWEKQTCIKFVPLSDSARKPEFYIKFYNSTNSCFSDIGRSINQRPQLLGLSKGCMSIPVILHELGHALGMIHPMSRDDRNSFIDVRIQNIKPGADRNFMTMRDRGYMYFALRVPYDYKSIMQYSPTIWSWNGDPTMVTLKPEYQSVLGNADDVSFYDKLYIHRRYHCGWQCTGYCENGGIVGGKSCKCICPDGYHGNYCEKRLPGASRIITWRCRNGWTFRIGMCYNFFSSVTSLSWRQAQTFCQQNSGSLPIIKDQETFDTMADLVLENKELSTSKSFWLGLNYNKASGKYIWTDGNELKHQEWLSKEKSDTPCAVFNGTDIINSGCDKQSDNGVFCTAPFDPSCGGKFQLHQSTDVTSPNYPDLYPSDITCQYVFKDSNNRKIQLTFQDFLLEYSKDCRNDYVEVQLGTDVSIPGKRYCGTQLINQTLVSDGNFAIVTLKANSKIQGRGFKLEATPVLVFRNSGTSQHFAFTRNIRIPLSFFRKLFENLPSRLGEG